jgi:hypothetical protein
LFFGRSTTNEDAEMHATALSARLESLRDRRLGAFMMCSPLQAVRRLQGSLLFLREASERDP